MVGQLFSHLYFARCDRRHSRKVQVVSECRDQRTRHYEYCRDCGGVVAMTATVYIKPVAVYLHLEGDYSGNRRSQKKAVLV